MKLYDAICEVKEWDSPERVELKNKMRKLYIKQEKLEQKFVSVREYAEFGYEINRIKAILDSED